MNLYFEVVENAGTLRERVVYVARTIGDAIAWAKRNYTPTEMMACGLDVARVKEAQLAA